MRGKGRKEDEEKGEEQRKWKLIDNGGRSRREGEREKIRKGRR